MKPILSSLALCLAFIMQPVQADLDDDCKKILDAAQQVYRSLFPGKPKTQFIDSWCYRHYKTKEFGDIYAGINRSTKDEFKFKGVHLLGKPFGDTPYYVGQADVVLASLKEQLNDTSQQNEICDNNDLSSQITYRTQDDTTYVSTNGQCIELPEGRGICDTPSEKDEDFKAIETNVHLLTRTTIFNLEVTGINIPGVDLDSIVQQASNHCTIHAPSEIENHTVHSDICIDVTRQITSSLGGISIPGLEPPITTRYEGTSILTRVDDCFDTDANSIVNVVTGEVWQNKNGNFVKVN